MSKNEVSENDLNHAAIVIQRLFRHQMFVNNRKRLGKTYYQRQMVVQELLDTEQIFCNQLNKCINVCFLLV